MSFARPQLLWLALLLVPLLLVFVTVQAGRLRRLGDAFGGPIPARRLTGRDLYGFPSRRAVCLGSAAALLVVAASGPRLGPAPGLDGSRPVDLHIALDVSTSMTSADVGTSRIERAKLVVERLTSVGEANRVGLAVFADWPLTLVPPTDDPGLVRFFSQSLDADLIQSRDQGTRVGLALADARQTFDLHARPGARHVVLLVSDGESQEDRQAVLDSVASVVRGEVRVWTAGIGTTGGFALDGSTTDGRAVLDETGEPVVAVLNAELLRRVADEGGGRYFDVSDDAGLNALVRGLRADDDWDDGAGTAAWLVLFAALLIAIEAGLDAGLGERRPRRRAES